MGLTFFKTDSKEYPYKSVKYCSKIIKDIQERKGSKFSPRLTPVRQTNSWLIDNIFNVLFNVIIHVENDSNNFPFNTTIL